MKVLGLGLGLGCSFPKSPIHRYSDKINPHDMGVSKPCSLFGHRKFLKKVVLGLLPRGLAFHAEDVGICLGFAVQISCFLDALQASEKSGR